MAISYSYPKALNITNNDLLFGTQASGNMGIKNVTKSFSVGSLVNFITSNLPFQSLTTNNTAGVATLVDGVLNIPEYTHDPGYRMYTALLTSTGSTLSVDEVYDTLGTWSISFARTTTGTYTATISGHLSTFKSAWYALTDNRLSLDDGNYMVIKKTSGTVLTIYTYKNYGLSDGVLEETPVEIRLFS
jgi:hypothetical protein